MYRFKIMKDLFFLSILSLFVFFLYVFKKIQSYAQIYKNLPVINGEAFTSVHLFLAEYMRIFCKVIQLLRVQLLR